jgi:hypothetical protein
LAANLYETILIKNGNNLFIINSDIGGIYAVYIAIYWIAIYSRKERS